MLATKKAEKIARPRNRHKMNTNIENPWIILQSSLSIDISETDKAEIEKNIACPTGNEREFLNYWLINPHVATTTTPELNNVLEGVQEYLESSFYYFSVEYPVFRARLACLICHAFSQWGFAAVDEDAAAHALIDLAAGSMICSGLKLPSLQGQFMNAWRDLDGKFCVPERNAIVPILLSAAFPVQFPPKDLGLLLADLHDIPNRFDRPILQNLLALSVISYTAVAWKMG